MQYDKSLGMGIPSQVVGTGDTGLSTRNQGTTFLAQEGSPMGPPVVSPAPRTGSNQTNPVIQPFPLMLVETPQHIPEGRVGPTMDNMVQDREQVMSFTIPLPRLKIPSEIKTREALKEAVETT